MTSVEYKAPGGKMIKLDIDISGNRILHIKITGDFFMHPEESIVEIEKMLTNSNIGDVEEKLNYYVKTNKILMIGATVRDIIKAIELARKKAESNF